MFYDLLVIGNDALGLQLALESARRSHGTALVEFPDSWIHTWLQELVQPFLPKLAETTPAPPPVNLTRYRYQWLCALELAGVDVFRAEDSVKFISYNEILLEAEKQTVRSQQLLIASGLLPWFAAASPSSPENVILVPDSREEVEQGVRLARDGWPLKCVIPRNRQAFSAEAEWLTLLEQKEPSVTICEELVGVKKESPLELMLTHGSDRGSSLSAEAIYAPAFQQGLTAQLNLDGIGLETDERGKLWCDDQLQTWVSGIYAAGDVVGFPPLSLRQQWEVLRRSSPVEEAQSCSIPFST